MKSGLDQKNKIERIFKFMQNRERSIRMYRKINKNESIKKKDMRKL